MPSRRTTLIGLGALAAGGTGAVATGAFTAATAERDVSVEFADDDTQAILAFQPTSDYASLSEDELDVSFEDLNTSAQFTFNDTFVIINNGGEDISLDRVGSGDNGNPQWRNEDEEEDDESAASVLIGQNVNEWQATPTEDNDLLDASAIENVDVNDTNDGNTGGGSRDADANDFTGITLTPGDWISVGFEIGNDALDEFADTDIPETLQFEFGSDVQ